MNDVDNYCLHYDEELKIALSSDNRQQITAGILYLQAKIKTDIKLKKATLLLNSIQLETSQLN